MWDDRGDECEPFVVKAIDSCKSKDKNDLAFKKGTTITVERVNLVADEYYGFVQGGKKEGWFPKYYVTPVRDGKPETRKVASHLASATAASLPTSSGGSKKVWVYIYIYIYIVVYFHFYFLFKIFFVLFYSIFVFIYLFFF